MPSPTRKRKRNAANSGPNNRVSRRVSNAINAAQKVRKRLRNNPANHEAFRLYSRFVNGKRHVLKAQINSGLNRVQRQIEDDPEAQETIAKMKKVCDTFQKSGGMIGATPYGYNEQGLTSYPQSGIWEQLADACGMSHL